jgi:hypothetical protein
MIVVCWGCWSIRDFPFDTWILGVIDSLSFCDHIEFPEMYDIRVGLVDYIRIHWKNMILNSGDDPLRHYILWLHERRMQSRQEDWIFMIIVAQR